MKVDLTLLEIENLLMMCSSMKRHSGHEYARTAVKKLEQARKDCIDEFYSLDRAATEVDQEDGKLF